MSYPFLAHSHRYPRRSRRLAARRPRLLPLLMAVAAAFTVRVETARAEPPRTELPQGMTVGSGTASYATSSNLGTITQQSQKAILNWQSFNVGRDAAVHFDHQMGASSATLNRIAGGRPSEIFGKLSADGTIYLINQNGIVFGSGAQVNVRGLVASSLDISDQLFLDGFQPKDVGTAVFAWNGDDQEAFQKAVDGVPDADGYRRGVVRLEPGAVIKTDNGGTVMLLAPRVENAGRIETPEGQTILAAGAKVYLDFSEDPSLRGFLVEVDPLDGQDTQGNPAKVGGTATNEKLGEIIAERGNVTMAAYAVRQLGRVSATTSVRLNGSIILKARDGRVFADGQGDRYGTKVLNGADRFGELTLGENSRTEITPEAGDETSADTQTFNSSYVELSGKKVNIQRGAHVVATGGEIVIGTGREGLIDPQPGVALPDDSRIYLDSEAVLDVSGTQQVAVPMERNFVPIRLLGDELKDSPNNRDGYLYRREVWVDLRRRSPLISNIDGYIDATARAAGERTTTGGSVKLLSRGEVILREGSNIDVSGGSLRYLDGVGRTTQLMAQGRVYDISEAPADIAYTGVAGVYTVRTRWGQREWIVPGLGSSSRNLQGYTEGKDAGKIQIVASNAVLDGNMGGTIIVGEYQRDAATMPKGPQLIIGLPGADSTPDYRMQAMRIVRERAPLPPGFEFDKVLPEAWKQELSLSNDMLRDGGFGRAELYSNGKITLDPGVVMNLGPGGVFTANARQIAVEGDIVAPGGTVNLKTADINTLIDQSVDPVDHDLQVGAEAQILTQGLWVNDLPQIANGAFAPVFLDGGSITLDSVADLAVAGGSLLDVSGGAWLDAAGKLKAGKGGAISLKSGDTGLGVGDSDRQQSKLKLGGELRGYAIGQGGKLTLNTTQVQIGGTPLTEQPTLFHLTPEFFHRGGFRDYIINGRDGLTVVAGTEIYPLATSLVLDSNAARSRSGAGIYGLSRLTTWPVENRSPGKLTLRADSKFFGKLAVQSGAVLRTDPLGEVNLTAGRQMTVDGTVEAPAGRIALQLLQQLDTVGKVTDVDNKSLWLGSSAKLLARGAVRRELNSLGLELGEVLDGGQVSISADGGYLVSEAGSVIDVSGTVAKLDVRPPAGSAVRRDVEIASDAGSVSLSAHAGMMLDGVLLGYAGGASSRGGALTLRQDNDKTSISNSLSRVVVSQNGSFVPQGLEPEQIIESVDTTNPQNTRYYGKAFVSLDRIKEGGFDALELASRHRIEFDGDAEMTLNRRLILDAQTVAASTNASMLKFTTPYFARVNSWGARDPVTALPGSAVFEVNSQFIDLQDHVGFDGFAKMTLNASDDIRLRGVFDPGRNKLTGSLTSAGDIELRADQIYPTTLTDYTLRVTGNSDGTITILPNGEATPVLSAGGRVTLSAPKIEHRGVLKAPQGEIVFGDTEGIVVEKVHVADKAVLSVAGEGQTVPFGSTQIDGARWIYSYGSEDAEKDAIKQVPEKRVTLAGENVQVDDGATINLEGGGDLYAYEFTPGAPGRSKDLLAPENAGESFAILPRLKGEFAPYDPQYNIGVGAEVTRPDGSKYTYLPGFQPGDSIYLSGTNGLPAGAYAILPARYALLDGAYLVTPVSGYRDLGPETRIARHDGGEIVSGYRVSVAQGGNLRDGRASGFIVRRGDQIRREADYGGSYASRFFDPATNRLPQDVGRLVLAASRELAIGNDVLRTAPADGGRGAEVDITADNIAIIGPDAGDMGAGFVTLDAKSLTNLNAASLLIGGTRRSGERGTEIDVTAAEVVLANDAQSPLQAPEVMLVAKDSVTLSDGAVLEGKGDATLSGADLVIQDDAAALVRVSSGAQVDVVRPENTRSDQGKVDIKAGAKLTAARSMILDGSKDVINAGTLAVGNGPGTGALALGASRVSFGNAPDGTPGLVLSGANLNALSGLEALTLRASQGLDVYGGVDIGFNNLNIDAPRISGYQNAGAIAVLSAVGDIALSNKSGTSTSGMPDGTGTLRLAAGDAVRLGDGAYGIAGYSDVTLAAGREIRAEGKGGLDVAGNLTLEAPRVTATTGADMIITAASGRDGANPVWHTLTLQRPAMVPATLPAVTDLAANLALLGKNVSIGTDIELPSGILRAEAKGADADDNVTVKDGANIKAGGAERAFADTFAYAPGGKVKLVSENGNVAIAAGANVDVAGVGAGDGGSLEVSAHQGKANIDGTISGGAGPQAGNDAQSGSFLLDVATLADNEPATTDEFSKLNTKLNDGGFTESREIRVGSGDIDIGADDVVRAQEFTLVADGGAIDVAGRIDASGYDGGYVKLVSRDDLTIKSGASIDASATGSDQNGGSVDLESSTGGILLEAQNDPTKTSIYVKGPTGGGKVNLRLLRSAVTTLTDSNPANHKLSLAGGIEGASRVTVEGVGRYTEADGILDANDVSATVAGSVGEQRYNEAVAFMQNEVAVRAALGRNSDTDFHLVPGVEINSVSSAANPNGDLTVTADWNLAGWRFNSMLQNPDGSMRNRPEVGVLTIRSAGDLNVNGSISDGFSDPTPKGELFADGDSWSYRFVAGADLGSAYASALDRDGASNFTLDKGKLIRTGSGSIDVAAAGDIKLSDQKSVIYTGGRDAEPAADFTVPSSASYPENGGDLSLYAGNDIIAAPSSQLVTDWLYRQGSNNVDGTIQKHLTWYLRFDNFQQGVGALGGGNVNIEAGNDISNLSAVAPTTGRLPGISGQDRPDENKLEIFGGGDMLVHAGRDILSGLYYVGRGQATIQADDSIVSGRSFNINNQNQEIQTLFGLGEAKFAVRVRRDLEVEGVFNPTMVSQAPGNLGGLFAPGASTPKTYFFSYGKYSAVDFTSIGGNVLLQNDLDNVDTYSRLRGLTGTLTAQLNRYRTSVLNNDTTLWSYYPSSLRIASLAADIAIEDSRLNLYPSSKGTLELLAHNDLDLSLTQIRLLDVLPTDFPTVIDPQVNNGVNDVRTRLDRINNWSSTQAHSSPALHRDDREPVRIVTAIGDILGGGETNADLQLSKPAIIQAGRDVRDLHVIGQNLRPEDVTRIEAGRDILFTTPGTANVQQSYAQIAFGGPGHLQVLAGRDVDLGSSGGIVTRGNLDNPFLPEGGASILVQAGVAGNVDRTAFIDRYVVDADSNYRTELRDYMRRITGNPSLDEAAALAEFRLLPAATQTPLLNTVFFTELRESGKEATDTKSARFGDYSRGHEAVKLMYPSSDNDSSPYQGDIKLFFSQIKTEQNGGIDLIAPGGTVNAGLATSSGLDKGDPGSGDDASYLGIVTVAGGGIRGYVLKDFLVNQSRVFTLQGGDILLWATKGDIDAGRGARVTSATPPPRLRVTGDGQVVLDLTQSVSGSGIGALRANPDAPESNVYLFAPEGTVNAGEAGIRVSGNLTIGAQQVLGADIIQAGGVSVGVPTDAGSAAAGLAGVADSAATTSKSAEEAATSGRQDDDGQLTLDVEVVSYGGDTKGTELRIKKEDKEKDKNDKNP